MKKIKYEEWIDEYLPKTNHLDSNAAYEERMFETYGAELGYILNLANSERRNTIWTLVNGENETEWIIPGYSIVNRIGYFETENAWEDENIEVDMNEHISINNAIKFGLEFAKSIGFILDTNTLTKWYKNEFKQETIPVGDAKYHLLQYFDEELEIGLSSEQEDKLHNFYSQL